jgi:dolichol-phosphate mannosyltransferase
MTSPSRALVSIVVPAYNEQACLPLLAQAVDETFRDTPWEYELIVVNDGSTDDTGQILDDLAQRDPRVRGIHLARNFGHQPAMLAGLAESRGCAVITMDADLEQPPAAALAMLELWKSGAQIVHGVRQDHPSTGWWKRTTSRWFYKALRFLSRIPIEPGMLDFRLYDRTVVDTLLSLPEADFFLRGLSVWVGFRQARLRYQAGKRAAGRTKFHNRAMFSFALRGITSFSTFPLRLATYLGLLMTLVSLGFGAYVGIRHFFWERPQPGYASTILLIAFLMGIQFLLMGLLGEYVGRIHLEVKHRPRYLVARRTPPGSDDTSP